MLETADAATPREFLKAFADIIGGGTRYEPVKILAEVIKEFADENPSITWFHAVYIVDFTYTIIAVLGFTMEFKDVPNTPISTVINSILHSVSRDPVLCRLFLPVVDYIKQNAPEFATGVPCTCP
jgi:hypothetical protein